VGAHSAVGRKHGISEDDTNKLLLLERADFEMREWVLLKYVQDWTFLKGEEPAGEHAGDYKKIYSKRERKYFLKLMRMMNFANYLGNWWFRKPWIENGTLTCTVPGSDDNMV